MLYEVITEHPLHTGRLEEDGFVDTPEVKRAMHYTGGDANEISQLLRMTDDLTDVP